MEVIDTEARLLDGKIVAKEDDSVLMDLSEFTAENKRFWLGLSLALTSTVFIGASFIVKKIALIHLQRSGGMRAGSGGYGYLRNWLWWTGLLTMAVGEACNFSAYALVSASLVTPLGALSVLVSALLASHFLQESLNLIGKLGCCLCILGSTVLVIHAPTEGDVANIEQLGSMLTDLSFVLYILFVVMVSCILILFVSPKYGNRNVLVYVLICSLIGSLSVMACKGLGLAIRETLSGQGNRLSEGLFWLFLFSVVASVTVQMNYLNKALDMFDTSLVTPIYYVFFTTFVLLASNILFKEWKSMFYQDMLGTVCGFFILIIAIFLLNAFTDYDITFESLKKHWVREKNQAKTNVKLVFNDSMDPLIQPNNNPKSVVTTTASSQKKLTKTRRTKKRSSQPRMTYSSTDSPVDNEFEV